MFVRNSILLIFNFVAFVLGMTYIEQTRHRNFPLLPKSPHCSETNLDNMTGRIVGGEESELGQFPWISRLGYVMIRCAGFENAIKYDCGSSLITETALITAAHCVVRTNGFDICPWTNKRVPTVIGYVKLGDWDQTNGGINCVGNNCGNTVQIIKVKTTTTHAHYRSTSTNFDISLIILATPAKMTVWVNPICLPMGSLLSRSTVGQIGEVAGWGMVDSNDRHYRQAILKFVKVPIVDISACRDFWINFINLPDAVICAGGNAREDSCNGDSGGPLMIRAMLNGYKKQYLAGMVSFGPVMCGTSGKPAVYTSITYFMKWILDNLQ